MPPVNKRTIPRPLYSKIHAAMPIVCADTIVRRGDKVLLVKRKVEPLAGEWYLPGGRILKNECLTNAAQRIVPQETGIKIGYPRFVGYNELFWELDPFKHGMGTHTISFVFVADAVAGNLKANQYHSDVEWFDLLSIVRDENMNRQVRRMLEKVNSWQMPGEL